MSQEPGIEERAALNYAGVQVAVPMGGISGAVDEVFPELFGWLASRGIEPGGPPFIRYLVIDMDALLRLELGVPIPRPVSGSGRVQPGVLPGGRYAVLRYTGPYEGLIAAHADLQRWARDSGVEFDTWDTSEGSAWQARVEHYLTDPAREPDPGNWETEVAYLTKAPGRNGLVAE
jgi:effector-binding domain-containing protein